MTAPIFHVDETHRQAQRRSGVEWLQALLLNAENSSRYRVVKHRRRRLLPRPGPRAWGTATATRHAGADAAPPSPSGVDDLPVCNVVVDGLVSAVNGNLARLSPFGDGDTQP